LDTGTLGSRPIGLLEDGHWQAQLPTCNGTGQAGNAGTNNLNRG
jgi:hypothetical protein